MANKNNERWWGIFRTGSFTDMNGQKVEADEKKIDQIIEATKNFAYQNDEIPIVIGHPKADSPKWGSVNKNDLAKQSDKNNGWINLLAKPKDLVKEFSEWIEKKMYNAISISLRPDLSIKHIGFLGATPPAVTGLPSVYLSEEDEKEVVFEFSEFAQFEISSYPFRKISELFRGVKNFMVEQKGAEYANTLLPEDRFTNLDEAPRVFQISEDTAQKTFSEKTILNNKNKSEDEMKTIDELNKEVTNLSETLETTKTEKENLKTENEKLKAKQLEGEIKLFCESPEMAKKITPALQPVVEGLYTQLSTGAELSFSEGEGEEKKEVKLSPVEGLKKILSNLPDAVEFSETTNKENASKTNKTDMGDAEAISKKALEFVESEKKAGRTISISAAVKHVVQENS